MTPVASAKLPLHGGLSPTLLALLSAVAVLPFLAHGHRLSADEMELSTDEAETKPGGKELMGKLGEALRKQLWDQDGIPKPTNTDAIGSAADKDARKQSALSEPAWEGCGQEVGVKVWRIEKFEVKEWPHDKYGQFHSGDSYIVLSTRKKNEDGEALAHDIFFWLGRHTTVDEQGVAAYKTVELDAFFDDEPVQHREVQSHESQAFKKLFPKLSYLKGGVDSGMRKVHPVTFPMELQKIFVPVGEEKAAGKPNVQPATLSLDEVNPNDAYVFTDGHAVYVWAGKGANQAEKYLASTTAHKTQSKLKLKLKDVPLIKSSGPPDRFLQLLGSACPNREPAANNMFELSDEKVEGRLVCSKVDFDAASLNPKSVMLVEAEKEILVWVGPEASAGERGGALRVAMDYLKVNKLPMETSITMLQGGQSTSALWKSLFPTEDSPDLEQVDLGVEKVVGVQPVDMGGDLVVNNELDASEHTEVEEEEEDLEEVEDPGKDVVSDGTLDGEENLNPEDTFEEEEDPDAAAMRRLFADEEEE